jgi:hypothetical protein
LEKNMGWLYGYERPKNVIEHLKAEALTWTPKDGVVPEVVAAAKVGNTVYFAVKFPKGFVSLPDYYVPEADGSIVVALVFLISLRDGFGYKDMDECCGPCEATCPPSLLDKLSALKPADGSANGLTWATNWRARCRAHAEVKAKLAKTKRAMKAGVKVTLAEPLTFTNGRKLSRFEIAHYVSRGKTRTAYRSLEDGGLYRVPTRALASAVIE